MNNQISQANNASQSQSFINDDIYYEFNDILANLQSVYTAVEHALSALLLTSKIQKESQKQSLIEVVTDSMGGQLAVMQWEIQRLKNQLKELGGEV